MEIEKGWLDYEDELRSFIISKVKDVHITNDILQETYIKAQTNFKSLNDSSKMKPWLFSIARNTVFDYFRKQQSEMLYVPKALEEQLLLSDDALEKEHTPKDCLLGIIKVLPKKYRDPLFLADIKGLKQKEIALQLNLPLPTVKSQIQRARKLIAQGYMDCCDYKLNEKGVLVGEIKERAHCKVCSD